MAEVRSVPSFVSIHRRLASRPERQADPTSHSLEFIGRRISGNASHCFNPQGIMLNEAHQWDPPLPRLGRPRDQLLINHDWRVLRFEVRH